MKTPMTNEILAVIDLIHSQRRVYAILHHEILKDKYDYIKDVERIYNDIPLPEGMNRTKACFEAVLNYPINDKIMNTDADKLASEFQFGF